MTRAGSWCVSLVSNLGAIRVIAYLVLTAAVSIVAFFHLRFGHCGELSSPSSCEFVRGSGGLLLLLGPTAVLACASILALWRGRPLLVHVSAAVVITAVLLIDVTTIA
jgi:hypothetical protein